MKRKLKTPPVRFALKRPNSNEPTLISAIFRYISNSNKRLVYSTGEKIHAKYWDKKSRRAKSSIRFPQGADLNRRLNMLESIIIDIYRENDFGQLTIEEFKQELSYRTGKEERPEDKLIPNLFEFIDNFIEQRSKSSDTKRGTDKVLKTVFNILKDFAEFRRKPFSYDDIDFNFKYEFQSYLYREKQHSINYAAKVFTVLRQFMNASLTSNYHNNMYFKSREFSVKKIKKTKVVLSFYELDGIANLDLSANNRLDKVRDLFLIGAYTGFRFSDFTRISRRNVKAVGDEKLIFMRTAKTGTEVAIPVLPELDAILSKYDYNSPQKISNQKFNQYIKEICELAGIDEPTVHEDSKGGKIESLESPKYELVSSHSARRSFATNFYLAEFPVRMLMQITGHATERQFLEYIHVGSQYNALEFSKMASAKLVPYREKAVRASLLKVI